MLAGFGARAQAGASPVAHTAAVPPGNDPQTSAA